jgi:hypothetical protein
MLISWTFELYMVGLTHKSNVVKCFKTFALEPSHFIIISILMILN